MLLDVESFRQRVDFDLDTLVSDLQEETHRSTSAEATAWRNSLPTFARVLANDALKDFHIHVGHRGDLMVEYRLPSSANWADLVLLGRGKNGPVAVIVELKDWNTAGDMPGPREGLVFHAGRELSHPSDQVKGYVNYCQRFHSAVQEDFAEISGCVFFTFASSANPYFEDPHRALVEEFPVFTRSQLDITENFPKYLCSKLVTSDPKFARRFEEGIYHQDRGFVRQISQAIQNLDISPFVLLDEQRLGFQKCMKQIERVLTPAKTSTSSKKKFGKKSVVIIEGPPGSGKSVVAAHLWATLSSDDRIDGNVMLTTTSGSQKSNWEALFEKVRGERAARGVVLGANQYNPGISWPWVKKERELGFPTTVSDWRKTLKRFDEQGIRVKCPDDSFAVSIVDEAHGLIDPSVEGKKGIPPSGWAIHAGPQAYHVIRSSRVSIFLMDSDQSYRDNETTTRASIEQFAADFGVENVEIISLAGAQFRCGGSTEYMGWLDSTLNLNTKIKPLRTWRRNLGGSFGFDIVDSPIHLENALRTHISTGCTARLLASYARKWITQKEIRPHALPFKSQDFQLEFIHEGKQRTWSRIWNFTPDQDYSLFVQGFFGSQMAKDQLCEIGCPYVVRGFDFDYIGLLWLKDLVWRDNRWQADLKNIHESSWKNTRAHARNERGKGAATEVLLQRLQRGYRILLSRAIKGAYVWFEDDETRDHVQKLLVG